MAGIVIQEQDLVRLSMPTRRELLALVAGELPLPAEAPVSLEAEDNPAAATWQDQDDVPYPLGVREAKDLVRGLSEGSRSILRVFCQNVRSGIGYGSVEALMAASGHDDPHRLGKAMSGITRRLRTVTGRRDAWIIDWLDEDRVWDAERGASVITRYILQGPTLKSLCHAFGIKTEAEPHER